MGSGVGSLAGNFGSRVRHDLGELARPAGRPPSPFEGFDVVGEDGPDRSDLGPVQALAGQHAPHVGLRGLELGGGLGYRK